MTETDERHYVTTDDCTRAFDTLLDNLPGLAYRCRNDRDRTMEFISAGCQELTGYSPAELINSAHISYAQLIHPDDRDMVWDEVQRALKLRQQYLLRYRIHAASGDEKQVWETGCGVFSESGELQALEGIVLDVSAQKQIEDQLRIEKSQLAALIGSTDDLVWSVDLDFRLLTYNQALEDHLRKNYGTHAKLGTHINDLLPPDRTAQWPALYERVLKEGSHQLEYGLPDGRSLNMVVNRIMDAGKPVGVSVFGKDITERKQAELELRKSEAFRKRLFDTSTIPIIVMDVATIQYVDCNPAAVRIYGCASREEVLGKTPLDFSAPVQYDGTPSPEKARHYIEKALKEETAIFEWRHLRPDGELWDAEVHLMSFLADQRQFLQFSLLDITERKLAEEALVQSENKYRDMLATSPVGIFKRTMEGRYLYFNHALVEQFEPTFRSLAV